MPRVGCRPGSQCATRRSGCPTTRQLPPSQAKSRRALLLINPPRGPCFQEDTGARSSSSRAHRFPRRRACLDWGSTSRLRHPSAVAPLGRLRGSSPATGSLATISRKMQCRRSLRAPKRSRAQWGMLFPRSQAMAWSRGQRTQFPQGRPCCASRRASGRHSSRVAALSSSRRSKPSLRNQSRTPYRNRQRPPLYLLVRANSSRSRRRPQGHEKRRRKLTPTSQRSRLEGTA